MTNGRGSKSGTSQNHLDAVLIPCPARCVMKRGLPHPLDSRFRGNDEWARFEVWHIAKPFGRSICYRPSPPAHWIPAFAGMTNGRGSTSGISQNHLDAELIPCPARCVMKRGLPHPLDSRFRGNDEWARFEVWHIAKPFGRSICYRPSPPAHWIPAFAGMTNGRGSTSGISQNHLDAVFVIGPVPQSTGFPPSRERREDDGILWNQLETVLVRTA